MAGTISIISASAGSGKTHELTTILKDALDGGRVRPEAVVATTFTVKAAEELRHRARLHLLEAGRAEDARRLSAARIGTVNSICDRLVTDHAFDLGLSPRSAVMDEVTSRHALARAQSRALAPDQERELSRLSDRLNQQGYDGHDSWNWSQDVGTIIDRVRANGIDVGDLAECCRRSRESIRALLGARAVDGTVIRDELAAAIDRFVDDPAVVAERKDNTLKTVRRCKQLRRKLSWRFGAPWHEWVRLTKQKPGTGARDAFAAVRAAAARHDEHPGLHDDVDRAIELVFQLAAESLAEYERYKREHGLIDFVDQEVLALKLLREPTVADRLRAEVDLLLVDEFQDTSPVELAIFLRLAELANESIWVGDQKQAIYAFRGTDPSLMDAVIGQMLEDDPGKTLDRSWRSRPELVGLTSDVFVPPFAEHGIPESRVRLTAAHPTEPDGLGPVLERWLSPTRNKPDDAAALAAGVRALLADPEARVRDRISGNARPVRASDVAVLCRTNDLCAGVAASLIAAGVAARLPQSGLAATPEARVALCGL
ncbi:MAG: UvrD-helicase domain-containing protein, partial [Planctomycetota bacterium]